MGRKQLLVAFFSIILTVSCIPFKNYYYDANGITKPKKANFDLAKAPNPYQLKETDLIDTNAVYVHKFTTTFKDGSKKLEETYLRFFKNGRFFSGIKENNYNDFSHGSIGYYTLNKNNGIIIEAFRVYETGKYVKEYGYIKKDTIYLFKYPFKNKGFPKPNNTNCKIYILKKIANLSGTTSW